MASVKTEEGKVFARSPAVNFFKVDFSLRLFVLATSVAALVVELTSKQTEAVAINALTRSPVYRDATYTNSPALLYFLSALSVTCFYGVVSLVFSACAIKKPSPSTKLLLHMAVFDVLMAGVMASATGAGAGVAYIGLKGNSHLNWSEICNVYDKFCRHIGSSLALSLAGSVGLVLLVVLSLYTLHRRSR